MANIHLHLKLHRKVLKFLIESLRTHQQQRSVCDSIYQCNVRKHSA